MIHLVERKRILISSTGGTPIPTGNLVLYMRMNGSSADETGNHAPTSSGIIYRSGIFSGQSNEAADFRSGIYSVYEIPDSDLLSFGDGTSDNPFSISLGYEIDSKTGNNNWILDKRGTKVPPSSGSNREYQIQYSNTNNELQFTLFDDSTGGTLRVRGGSLSTTTAYHVVFTYDGSSTASGLKIYVDGVSQSLTDDSSGSYTAMENLLSEITIGGIGWASGTNANEHDGAIDGLGIWNKELSQEEVDAIYAEQSAGNELL
jgi:hypothetical protein